MDNVRTIPVDRTVCMFSHSHYDPTKLDNFWLGLFSVIKGVSHLLYRKRMGPSAPLVYTPTFLTNTMSIQGLLRFI